MRILVTGAEGLIGRAIVASAASARPRDHLIAVGRSDGDVADPRVREALLDRHKPDAVLFCAAFTAVDRAGHPDDIVRSEQINVHAPGDWARRVPLWWLSSNFVFSTPGPHAPSAAVSPKGAYAHQKAQGEQAVMREGGNVCRVGWVYGPGGRTFGSTLVERLRAGHTVAAVADVLVQPTWSLDVARSLLTLPEGTSHHMAAETTSWYGFALAVQACLERTERTQSTVAPVRLADLALPDPRPRDARLEPATLPGWRSRLNALVT
jgi:dTDP-4-dehydrorhamnose reductase